MVNRAHDWLDQAAGDLEAAEHLVQSAKHDWACFAAQQCAEKAVKALHFFHGQEEWGHVIKELLEDLPKDVLVPVELVEKARVLDNFYIPTRYPNAHAAGAPLEHYGPLQSEVAVRYAREILEFARLQMAQG
jgi:HEPN domain-containing protein